MVAAPVTLLGTAVLTLAACSGSSAPVRDAAGSVIEAGSVEVLELEVGDCFNQPGADEVTESGEETVLSVEVVPCAEPHVFEVYHSFDLPDGEYPGAETVEDQWIAGCIAQFEGFIGVSFEESELDISAIFPTEDTWNGLDDREVLCSVTAVSGESRTASARGAGV